MIRRLLILVAVFVALVLLAFGVKAMADNEVEPSYILVYDEEEYGYIWEAGGAEYVYGNVERYCPCAEPQCFAEETPQIKLNLETPTPQIAVTLTPFSPTATKVVPTTTRIIPIATLTNTPTVECEIVVCHKPGTAAEKDYCCESSAGCLEAHLGHSDYEGKCR